MIAVQPLPAALTTFKVNLDASSPTLHTITKCDGTTHDARGLYTTTSSYNFGGLSPVALDDTQLLFLAAAVFKTEPKPTPAFSFATGAVPSSSVDHVTRIPTGIVPQRRRVSPRRWQKCHSD